VLISGNVHWKTKSLRGIIPSEPVRPGLRKASFLSCLVHNGLLQEWCWLGQCWWSVLTVVSWHSRETGLTRRSQQHQCIVPAKSTTEIKSRVQSNAHEKNRPHNTSHNNNDDDALMIVWRGGQPTIAVTRSHRWLSSANKTINVVGTLKRWMSQIFHCRLRERYRRCRR